MVTLRWCDGVLELIDQRCLPHREVYVRCTSADEVAGAIRGLVVRGAPAIGCAAAYGLALAAQAAPDETSLTASIARAHERLAASRPTAVNLFWALARMRRAYDAIRDREPMRVAARLLDEAHRILAEDLAANRAMGALGASLLPERARILTHCNAGALATAGHGTALGVIRSAVAAGKVIEVYADETRPILQGARLTAWEMRRARIPVTLIVDGAAGHLMSRGRIDAVIVGADRVAANGDVANKIGTYPLAVLARRHGVPFYVACPVSTIDPFMPIGADIPIEEREGEEVLGFGAERWAPDGVRVCNPAFDVTPAELVTALITERAIVPAPGTDTIAALLCAPAGAA